jgi:hypothetical protein
MATIHQDEPVNQEVQLCLYSHDVTEVHLMYPRQTHHLRITVAYRDLDADPSQGSGCSAEADTVHGMCGLVLSVWSTHNSVSQCVLFGNRMSWPHRTCETS